MTFWDNKGNKTVVTTADLSSLDALNLVNQGGADFDPHSVAQLQAWLSISPNATAAYQLAVQLAAMDLNVLAGDVKATDLVYAGGLLPYATADSIAGLTSGGFIDVRDLMQAANAALGQVNPGIRRTTPTRRTSWRWRTSSRRPTATPFSCSSRCPERQIASRKRERRFEFKPSLTLPARIANSSYLTRLASVPRRGACPPATSRLEHTAWRSRHVSSSRTLCSSSPEEGVTAHAQ